MAENIEKVQPDWIDDELKVYKQGYRYIVVLSLDHKHEQTE